MTSTNLEKLRQSYQDIEEKRKLAVRLLLNPPTTIKQEAYINHWVAQWSHDISDISTDILQTLKDHSTTGWIGEKSISGSAPQNLIELFYNEVDSLKSFHSTIVDIKTETPKEPENRSYQTMNDIQFDLHGNQHLTLFYDNERYQEWRRQQQAEGVKKKKKKQEHVISESDPAFTKFSGEEFFGRFLDLFELHQQYLSFFPDGKTCTYLEFLELLFSSHDLSWVPSNQSGLSFLSNLIDYISSFISKTMTFYDLPSKLRQIKERAKQDLKSKNFESNFKDQFTDNCPTNYCIYCKKQLPNSEEFSKHLTLKSHQRKVGKAEKKGGVDGIIQKKLNEATEEAEMRFTAFSLLNEVRDKLAATIENTKRRQSATAGVIEAEHDFDAPIVFNDSDDEEDEHFNNPKGLPLGWDGKPIPYWLYKLHGLSVEYKCEICGNKSYWGAASFEEHFFKKDHMNGLKALGIPSTKHFLYITSISEAQQLAAQLKTSLTRDIWQQGNEEIETESGEVMQKSIYSDLVRQGIIKPKPNKQ